MQEQFAPIPRFYSGAISAWDELERPLEPGVDIVEELPPPLSFEQPCEKCRGSGQFRSYSGRVSGQCFACKGAGKKVYRSSPEVRAKGKAKAQAAKFRKEEAIAAQAKAWIEANPAEAKWIAAKRESFGFAQAMNEALWKYGAFSEKQEEAIKRLCAADAERQAQWAAEKVQAQAAAPEISVAAIEKAFEAAKGSGIKKPRLRLASFVFSPAPASGINSGAIYVKSGEAYLGKIAQGKFLKVRSCEEVVASEVIEAAANPEAAAVAYGKRFGQCGCCGRELSNPESIERGIGPICAEKFGW